MTLPASLRQIDVRAFGGAEMKAYYEGTREEWEKISFRGGKNSLSGLSLYFLSPEQPKDAGARQAKNVRETGLWHCGSRGERLIWEPAAKEQTNYKKSTPKEAVWEHFLKKFWRHTEGGRIV